MYTKPCLSFNWNHVSTFSSNYGLTEELDMGYKNLKLVYNWHQLSEVYEYTLKKDLLVFRKTTAMHFSKCNPAHKDSAYT